MKIFAGQNHPQMEINVPEKLQGKLKARLHEQSSIDSALAFCKQNRIEKTGSSYGKYGVNGYMYTWPVFGK